MIPRLHLFEIHDSAWCPVVIRDALTDYLQAAERAGGVYDAVAEKLAHAVDESGASRIVDLCSGGAGPWPALYDMVNEKLDEPVELFLTDLLPNVETLEWVEAEAEGQVRFHPEPVDALNVPEDLDGFRTMFTAFHHFQPEQARAILEDAVECGQGIALFEATERSVRSVLLMLLAPIMVWLLTPTIRPFRWSRLLWTYLIPLVPLAVLFDGVVSSLRTYTAEELEEFIDALADKGYIWEAGTLPIARAPLEITYLLGWPSD